MFDNLWIEKYRPAALDQMVMSGANRKIFEKFAKSGEIPNLLFVGVQGIGKTSLAKIICKDVLQCQYLYINASDENGIDTIRNKVTSFARTMSFDGKVKCIILDETDGLSIDAQRALRNTMEEYAAITRFILTANYKHRIIPPLQSRCQFFDLTPDVEGCENRIKYILQQENVPLAEADQPRLSKFVKSCYPDLRKCVNELQKNIIDGKINFDNITAIKNSFVSSLYEITRSGLTIKARKKVIENEHVFNSDYQELLRSLFNHIHENEQIDATKKAEHLVMVSEYIYRSAFVADQEINFYTCLLSLN